jgi:hypothetical protein
LKQLSNPGFFWQIWVQDSPYVPYWHAPPGVYDDGVAAQQHP